MKYTCSHCNQEFETIPDWTDENMRQELEGNMPELKDAEQAVVCDDCYKLLMKFYEGVKEEIILEYKKSKER